jgi:hypothetical protein
LDQVNVAPVERNPRRLDREAGLLSAAASPVVTGAIRDDSYNTRIANFGISPGASAFNIPSKISSPRETPVKEETNNTQVNLTQEPAANLQQPPTPTSTNKQDDFTSPSFEQDIQELQKRGFTPEVAKQMVDMQRSSTQAPEQRSVEDIRSQVEDQIKLYTGETPETIIKQQEANSSSEKIFDSIFDKKLPEIEKMIQSTSRTVAMDIIENVWRR